MSTGTPASTSADSLAVSPARACWKADRMSASTSASSSVEAAVSIRFAFIGSSSACQVNVSSALRAVGAHGLGQARAEVGVGAAEVLDRAGDHLLERHLREAPGDVLDQARLRIGGEEAVKIARLHQSGVLPLQPPPGGGWAA